MQPHLVAVSACLLGTACRYDGCSKGTAWIQLYSGRVLWMPFCPEMLAGMGVPRPPIEHVRRHGRWRVENSEGKDFSRVLARVGERLVEQFRAAGVEAVILKEKSPSCGVRHIYVSGQLDSGMGVVAHRLKRAGFRLFTEEDEAEFGAWLAALDSERVTE